MRIVERIPAHYEVEEVKDLGRVYRWCPERVVVECGQCTKRIIFNRSKLLTSVVTCGGCGARSTAGIREELLVEVPTEDEVTHPWRYWPSRRGAGIPF